MENTRFDLQIFAEGGAGDGGAAAGGQAAAAGSAQQAENGPVARGRRRENPLANVQYGRRQEVTPQVAPAGKQQAAEGQTTRASFDELIAGDYKQDYQQRLQAHINDRLKSRNERDQQLTPILQMVAQRYGMDASDVSKLDLTALHDKIADDASQYEAEALERGMEPETLAKLKKLERMEAEKARMREQQAQQSQIQAHLQRLVQQGEQLRQLYPGFDLEKELQNPAFVRLTAPNVGVDLRTAYEVVHRDEMRGAEMQFAASKAAQRVSASVAANGRRPAENGTQAAAAAITKSDPRTLSSADREEIRRRVRNGEKISF